MAGRSELRFKETRLRAVSAYPDTENSYNTHFVSSTLCDTHLL